MWGLFFGGQTGIVLVVATTFMGQTPRIGFMIVPLIMSGGIGAALGALLVLAVRPQFLETLKMRWSWSVRAALVAGCITGACIAILGPVLWFTSLPADAVFVATAIAAVAVAVWTAMAYFALGRVLFRVLPDAKAEASEVR